MSSTTKKGADVKAKVKGGRSRSLPSTTRKSDLKGKKVKEKGKEEEKQQQPQEKDKNETMREQLSKLERSMKRLVTDLRNRSASCGPRQPIDHLGRTPWNDRFFVTLSKDNEVQPVDKREFFGSSSKDKEWAIRQTWRGLGTIGSTESTYACVKRNFDLLTDSVDLSQYRIRLTNNK